MSTLYVGSVINKHSMHCACGVSIDSHAHLLYLICSLLVCVRLVHDGLLLPLQVVLTSYRHLKYPQAKLVSLLLLVRMGVRCPDEVSGSEPDYQEVMGVVVWFCDQPD